MSHPREIFQEEAIELVEEMTSALLELEKSSEDKESVAKVFRSLHTIKGSGAMFGFADISEFAHSIETVFDEIRSGNLSVSKDIIDLTLSSADIIRSLLFGAEPGDKRKQESICEAFRQIVAGKKKAGDLPIQVENSTSGTEKSPSVYRIRFRPHPDLFLYGVNPNLLFSELIDLGKAEVTARLDDVPDLESIDPEMCYASWEVVLHTDAGRNAVRDVFLFVEDKSELQIEAVGEEFLPDPQIGKNRERHLHSEPEGIHLPEADSPLAVPNHPVIDPRNLSVPSLPVPLSVKRDGIDSLQPKRRTTEIASSIRIPAEKLDKLVDLVGEMVTVQARLTQMAHVLKHPEVSMIGEILERLTTELRDRALELRMVPIGFLFTKFQRLVHDLGKKLGKEADLITDGGETELDKTVIDRLSDPLMHLIRNCMDHAMEAPDARRQANLPEARSICRPFIPVPSYGYKWKMTAPAWIGNRFWPRRWRKD